MARQVGKLIDRRRGKVGRLTTVNGMSDPIKPLPDRGTPGFSRIPESVRDRIQRIRGMIQESLKKPGFKKPKSPKKPKTIGPKKPKGPITKRIGPNEKGPKSEVPSTPINRPDIAALRDKWKAISGRIRKIHSTRKQPKAERVPGPAYRGKAEPKERPVKGVGKAKTFDTFN